jgi:hypothetical protein
MLVLRVNQATEVVADHFAQDLVLHGQLLLAADGFAELPLHHREDGLDVTPLMIMPSIVVCVVFVLEEDLFVIATDAAGGVAFEVEIWLAAFVDHRP